ncbi:MAG TPA: hypothetical protein VF824_09265 [Thermoanaerobaculia bacterium]|jgi:hypothetical protein
MRRSLSLFFFLLFTLPAIAGAGLRDAPEFRRHYEVFAKDGTRLYTVTTIIAAPAEEASRHTLLIRDEGHSDFVLRWEWNYKEQVVTRRISDVRDKLFAQITNHTPFASKTRQETLAEAHANAALLDVPAPYRIETNGGRWEASDATENDATLRRLRHELRQSTDFRIVEAIERMQGTFCTTSDGDGMCDQFARYFMYDPQSDPQGVVVRNAAPDCAFDASLGFPCSDSQLERTRKTAGSRPY